MPEAHVRGNATQWGLKAEQEPASQQPLPELSTYGTEVGRICFIFFNEERSLRTGARSVSISRTVSVDVTREVKETSTEGHGTTFEGIHTTRGTKQRFRVRPAVGVLQHTGWKLQENIVWLEECCWLIGGFRVLPVGQVRFRVLPVRVRRLQERFMAVSQTKEFFLLMMAPSEARNA